MQIKNRLNWKGLCKSKEKRLFLLFFILIIQIVETIFIFSSGALAKKELQVEDLIFDNSAFILVDDVQLHYRIWQNYPHNYFANILLIHGLGGSTYSWRLVGSELARSGFQVLAVDLPGFGLSQRKPSVEQSHTQRAKLIWKLIDSLNLEGSWNLVGHSLGAGVIIEMALQRLSDVNTLTIVDGSIGFEDRKISSLFQRCKLLRNITAMVIDKFFLTKKRIKMFLKSAYGREPTSEEIDGYYQPLKLKNTYLTIKGLLRRYKTDINLKEQLPQLAIPTLCLWGREDKWVPYNKGEDIYQQLPKGYLVIIDEAAHCPMETHPNIFKQYLINFLRKYNIHFS